MTDIIQKLSPNYNARKAPIDMLVLHYTGMESGEAALSRMCDPKAEVSAHYMIEEDGRIFQLVEEDKRAWHAGISCWHGERDINSCSIGIEIVNGGHDHGLPDYRPVQIEAVTGLCLDIIKRWSIPATRIVGHSDIAPGRKMDPGEHFPWSTLAKAGVGVWPQEKDSLSHNFTHPANISDNAVLSENMKGAGIGLLRRNLITIGYGLEAGDSFDMALKYVITAFQRRFRPAKITGIADLETQNLIEYVRRAVQKPL